MRKHQRNQEVAPKTLRIQEAASRYSIGRGTMKKLAIETGAFIKIGKTALVNVSIIDDYMDTVSSGCQDGN